MKARFIHIVCIVFFGLSLAMQPFSAQAQASRIWMPMIIPGTEGAPRCEDGLIIDIDETVSGPGGDPTVQPTQVISKTYALVVGMVGDTYLGLPKAGTLRLGNTTWGSFVKNIPGSLGSKILSKTGAFFGLAVLIERICDRTASQGIPADAIDLGGGAGYIPMVQDIPDEGYIRYYVDASIPADNLAPGDLVAVVFNGVNNAGWIITSVPLVTGQKRYSMEVLDRAIPELVSDDVELTDPTPVADAWDEWYKAEKKQVDATWQPDLNQECPLLPASSFDFKARVMLSTQMELQRRLISPYSEASFEEKQRWTAFVDWASYELPRTELIARYKTPPPRSGRLPHDAHYTSLPLVGTTDDHDINIEMRCWWSEAFQEYIWGYNLIGELDTGLCATFGSGKDFVPEAYDYIN